MTSLYWLSISYHIESFKSIVGFKPKHSRAFCYSLPAEDPRAGEFITSAEHTFAED